MTKQQTDLIEISSWSSLSEIQQKVGTGFLSPHSMILLKNRIADCVKDFILEYPYVDKDFRSTYYSDFSKRHHEIDRNSYRLHLFGEDEQYFGFVTLRNTPPFNLGRSYIDPNAISVEKGHVLLTRFEVHLLGRDFTVDAFPWMQQDANISRCAQVSIWAISRYYSDRYSFYSEYTIQQIFDLASSHTRKIPSKGLTIENISNIFSSIGFYPEIYFSKIINNRKLFNEVIYIFIESGIPFVAALGSKRHAITVTGHVKPEKINDNQHHITPVSEIIDGYFSVDDNFLPYSRVGSIGKHSICDIDAIIVPLYEKMYLDVLTLLDRILPSLENDFLPHKRMYRRVFMTSSNSFKRFVRKNSDDDSYKSLIIMQRMPKFIWVAEYIVKEEYPDYVHSRFLFDATGMEYAGINNLLSAKIGKTFIFKNSKVELNSTQEYLYVNNLKEVKHEVDG